MKTIVHILPTFYNANSINFEIISSYGGAERYASELALEMSKNNDVTLMIFGDQNLQFKYHNLNIYMFKSHRYIDLMGKSILVNPIKFIKTINQFAIVHCHQYFTDTTMLACLSTYVKSKPIYVTDHGARSINISRYFPAKYFSKKFLGQTHYEKKRFNINDERFVAIYGGASAENAICDSNKTKDYILYVGRLMPHKGVEYLIEAITDERCYIVGHPRDKKYVNKLSGLIGKRRNIKMVTSATDADLKQFYAGASVIVLPSVATDADGGKHKHAELFGLVVAEAFKYSVPAIVTDNSALPYVVENEINGYVVSQNDSMAIRNRINMIMKNKKLRQALSLAAHDSYTKNYNWQAVSDKCVSAYEI